MAKRCEDVHNCTDYDQLTTIAEEEQPSTSSGLIGAGELSGRGPRRQPLIFRPIWYFTTVFLKLFGLLYPLFLIAEFKYPL